jgi:DNA repair exonuclease SbcCD ATPase subunit
MADENPSEFRFDDNEPEPETFYHEEFKDLRVEKLSQRLTLLSILLPCLVAVTIYFGYRQLSGKLSQSHATGSLEVQRLTKEIENLSKSFNEKLITFSTTLSAQDKDFGTSIEGRLLAMNKNIDVLQKNLKSLNDDLNHGLAQNQDSIEKLKVSKADKKSQAVAVEKINAAIKPLQKELQSLQTIRQDFETVSADIKKLESKLTEKIAALTTATDQAGQDYDQLQASVIKLADKTIDKDELALEIFKLKINFENQISEEVTALNRRLDAIQKEIGGSESISKTQKQSMKKVSKKTVSSQAGAAEQSGSASYGLPAPTGSITEKDLIE